MTDQELNNIDPKSFFAEQQRIYGAEHRAEQDYRRFMRAAHRVMKTREGQEMVSGLQRIVQFNSSRFRAEDNYNAIAAATRDGAAGAITEILVASQLANKDHEPLKDHD